MPTPDSVPAMMALGADGNVWFSRSRRPGKIGRITPGGYITEVAMPGRRRAARNRGGPATKISGSRWFARH